MALPNTHRSGIHAIAFSPARADEIAYGDVRMILGVHRGDFTIWEHSVASDQDKVRPTERVRGLAFSQDGRTLFGLVGERIAAWDAHSGSLRWEMKLPRHFGFLVTSPGRIAMRQDGQLLVASDDGMLFVMGTDGEIASRHKLYEMPLAMGETSDCDRIVLVESHALGFYNLNEKKQTTRKYLPSRIYAASLGAGTALVAVRSLRHVEIWQLDRLEMLTQFAVEPSPPLVALDPRGQFVVTGTEETIRFRQLTGEVISEEWVEGASIVSLFIAPSGDQVCLGLSDGTMKWLPVPGVSAVVGRV